jgi:hypothetical protein
MSQRKEGRRNTYRRGAKEAIKLQRKKEAA